MDEAPRICSSWLSMITMKNKCITYHIDGTLVRGYYNSQRPAMVPCEVYNTLSVKQCRKVRKMFDDDWVQTLEAEERNSTLRVKASECEEGKSQNADEDECEKSRKSTIR